nr:hypothetical protein [uncultured Anaerobutyricum sp.]
MRLGSVFKMRTSILNTATTEQMGYGISPFFVYTKSTLSLHILFKVFFVFYEYFLIFY